MERRGVVIRREDDMDDGGRQPNGGRKLLEAVMSIPYIQVLRRKNVRRWWGDW